MSGALIQLVSKGIQDVYLTSDEGHSFFRMKFTRHTNFSQAPKFIKTIDTNDTSITIPVLGDIVNGLWFESTDTSNANIASNLFHNSTLDLYIGGQKVDSQHYDYYAEIWPIISPIRTTSLKNLITRHPRLTRLSYPFTSSFVITKHFYLSSQCNITKLRLKSHSTKQL